MVCVRMLRAGCLSHCSESTGVWHDFQSLQKMGLTVVCAQVLSDDACH
jgi:hypothetical protein